MNTHQSLNPEAEFRYIVTWFREFSEYEKSDFMAILIQWLLKNSEVCINGMKDESELELSTNGRPLSIFLCRVKLFKDWTPKWPDQLRSKLVDKLNEIDSEFGLKLNQALEEALEAEANMMPNGNMVNGNAVNGVDSIHNGVAMLAVTED